jgi:hypothetical protein
MGFEARLQVRVSKHLLPFQRGSQMKKCTKCAAEKALEFFNKDKRQKDGHFYYCKVCCSVKDKLRYVNNSDKMGKAAKEHYEKNRATVRNRHLKKLYGIDLTHYDDMRKQQMFSCLICKEHEDTLKRGLYVDHCHTTGKVRGLLCQSCNFLLGMAKDDQNILKQAIKYLDDHTSSETID